MSEVLTNRRVKLAMALITSLAGLALALPAGVARADVVHGGGGFTCDGVFGCYIDGAVVDSCTGSLDTGPFRCEATVSGQLSESPRIFTQTTCTIYTSHFDPATGKLVFDLVYFSSHGTMIWRNDSPTTATLTAICPPQAAG
jgi:hypothetical protein